MSFGDASGLVASTGIGGEKMQAYSVHSCGCTVQRPCCGEGERLFRVVVGYYAYLQSPSFLLVSFEERERVWQRYYRAVNKYLCHCNPVLGRSY